MEIRSPTARNETTFPLPPVCGRVEAALRVTQAQARHKVSSMSPSTMTCYSKYETHRFPAPERSGELIDAAKS